MPNRDQSVLKEPFKIELPAGLEKAIAALKQNGGICRVVGGSVRDALLGIRPKDFDVEVYGMDLEVVADALKPVGTTNLVGKSFCVVKLRVGPLEYDFSIPRKERKTGPGHLGFEIDADPRLTEREALKRRDFTINALLYDPDKSELIDYYGGKSDLAQRRLRHVSDAFVEDPLRPLRAMQFAGRFDLTLTKETAEICASMKNEYNTLPLERIWGEWEKWSNQSKKPSAGLRALRDSLWLRFYRELHDLIRIPQDPEWHPEGDVWEHTLCCVDAMAESETWRQANENDRSSLMLGILCHDLGKPICTKLMDKRGKLRWTSHGHDSAGVPLSGKLLGRIGAFRKVAEPVPPLVGNHHFLNTGPETGPSAPSLRRLAQRLHPATLSQLHAVMTADHLGRPPFVSEDQTKRLAVFKERIHELEIANAAPKPILLGRHLIDRGMTPGKDFKEILESAFEAQLEGVFADLEGAIEWFGKK